MSVCEQDNSESRGWNFWADLIAVFFHQWWWNKNNLWRKWVNFCPIVDDGDENLQLEIKDTSLCVITTLKYIATFILFFNFTNYFTIIGVDRSHRSCLKKWWQWLDEISMDYMVAVVNLVVEGARERARKTWKELVDEDVNNNLRLKLSDAGHCFVVYVNLEVTKTVSTYSFCQFDDQKE